MNVILNLLMAIKDKSIEIFLAELASKAATPGGGSAAAFMGAQAAALTSMVCQLTIGKVKYAAVATEMQALLVQSEALRLELIDMIQADVEVFDQVMAAYGMPKSNAIEKDARNLKIQEVLKAATLVPLACAKACGKAIELSRIAAEKGNLGVISDAGVAVMSAYAGLKSAALNVYINTNSIKDPDFVSENLTVLEQILSQANVSTEEIYNLVKTKL